VNFTAKAGLSANLFDTDIRGLSQRLRLELDVIGDYERVEMNRQIQHCRRIKDSATSDRVNYSVKVGQVDRI
jgi:hypothetical protein